MEISGSETTANSPREMGCSGSEIVDIKSGKERRKSVS